MSPAASLEVTACQCNAGFSGPDGGTCARCSANEYKAGLGPAACTPCPANSVAAAGSTVHTACLCDAWYPGPEGGPCVDGTCQPGSTAVPTNLARACGSAQDAACNAIMWSQNEYGLASNSNDGLYGDESGVAISLTDGFNVFIMDLEYIRSIDYVNFWNREYWGWERIVGAEIWIGSSTMWSENTQCATLTDALQQTYPCNLAGRYVFIVQQNNYINFIELEVFGDACTACAANTHKAGQGNEACVACPAHSKSLPGSCAEEQCHCDAGFRKQGVLCVQCDENTYRESL